eukprot:CAMPEP_0117669928 /NCGR_PEP_ID=MMETSP0804-20121206/12428_1 /TAXON_ID=1074897 /ORGANISM="Tetraselmis astigmatica, Strain CCMP880" /LENGTH=311 /DNA_ID=CAMNT_0005478087 /DNA_START=202 /DNA_END=1137 /DNA_ORIENTATION=-
MSVRISRPSPSQPHGGWWRRSTIRRGTAAHLSCKASSAPHRAVVVLPGLGNSAADYDSFAALLSSRGFHTQVADVARIDWVRNALGLRYPEYWSGTLSPRPTVDWYLERIDAAVEEAKRATDGAPITLLAHSAGGWMGRVYMRDFGTTGLDRFVTLGSPHNPPPKDAPGVIDQTRGILTWMQDNCPGAFHSDVSYTTIAGKYLQGAPLRGGRSSATFKERVVGAGYQQVCGNAEEWGDGVVPVPSALLEGANHIVLEGVYHSPLGSNDVPAEMKAEEPGAARPWYGSESILDSWIKELGTTSDIAKDIVMP